ncbi:glutathione peroxidase [Paenibacillus segetis]|uniref:Glutathione peroxidase n=1 Tax=Paenibacillus segetis TaxID=1325360 RepID=A0ABQ1YP42_9BACL|nr:glutathione peroxidase [Paenibacillus segetis]GGH31759.1 glutathione peroxidase [Paenibacillus segetis]
MTLYDIEVKTIKGDIQTLESYRGQVLLIVNTATKCGFAPQFKGLQELYDTYKDQGFAVLGFPCGQFANQEPGTNEEVAAACELNFGVNFPLFAKVDVKGKDAHPLFQWLTDKAPGMFGTKSIKWNFTKFLVNQQGQVVKRFAPKDTPAQIASHISDLLTNGS